MKEWVVQYCWLMPEVMKPEDGVRKVDGVLAVVVRYVDGVAKAA